MAMLDEAIVSVPMGAEDIGIDDVKSAIARQAWGWYAQHKDDVVKKIWFWTIRIRDLYPLFVRLFGEPNFDLP